MRARKVWAAAAAVPLVVGSAGIAHADTIENTIDTTVGSATITAGGSTTVGYEIKVQGAGLDGEGGCNATPASPVTVTLDVPQGVTASASSLKFEDCSKLQNVTFSSTTAGSYAINVARWVDAGAGTYVNLANWTLKVNEPVVTPPPPPANTPPQVSVTGVTHGTAYEKSRVPQPGCSVVDAEDTDESATPVITGGAYNDLGEHTVTCSYTDGGTLTGSASATYTVVRDRDTSAPVIGYNLNPARPDGLNDWYKSDVTLVWTVTETESPETLQKTGCVDQAITADQAATTYRCSASSEGGSAVEQSVTIKRDSSGPRVSFTSASEPDGANGWYKSPVTATFTGTDGLSGPASATKTVTSSTEGAAVSLDSPAFTDAAGNTTSAGAATAGPFKIDSQAPNAPKAEVTPAPNAADWNKNDVTVSFVSQGDNGASGVASCTSAVTVDTETAGRVITGACTDNAGNVSEETSVTVKLDKNGPVVTYTSATGTEGNNGWYRSDVEATFTATDILSGPATATAKVASSGEGAAVEVSSPAFSDVAGNTTPAGAVTKTFKIDKTAPSDIQIVGGPSSTVYFGEVPSAAPTCEAQDGTSGMESCVVTGGGTTVGEHTLTATATDKAGNSATTTLTYKVLPWTMKGFYSPVDMNGVWNTVKGGSTVPLKFEVFAGSKELSSTANVKSFGVKAVTCPNGTATVDEIELLTTGGTSLRYDTTGGQFIQNWQTPKKPGSCYAVTMTTQDGSVISANFSLK